MKETVKIALAYYAGKYGSARVVSGTESELETISFVQLGIGGPPIWAGIVKVEIDIPEPVVVEGVAEAHGKA